MENMLIKFILTSPGHLIKMISESCWIKWKYGHYSKTWQVDSQFSDTKETHFTCEWKKIWFIRSDFKGASRNGTGFLSIFTELATRPIQVFFRQPVSQPSVPSSPPPPTKKEKKKRKKKKKIVSVLLSAQAKRFSVSRMQDFKVYTLDIGEEVEASIDVYAYDTKVQKAFNYMIDVEEIPGDQNRMYSWTNTKKLPLMKHIISSCDLKETLTLKKTHFTLQTIWKRWSECWRI